jgi:hypothetical protein
MPFVQSSIAGLARRVITLHSADGTGRRARIAWRAAPGILGAMLDAVAAQKWRTLCGFHQICCTTFGNAAIFIFPS